MNVQIGFFFFSVLEVITVWSWEVTMLRPVKSDNGEFMCGMSPPNKSVNSIESKVLCMSSCFYVCPSPCRAVNYLNNAKVCHHFYYIPCSYELQQDCINYQVIIVQLRSLLSRHDQNRL